MLDRELTTEVWGLDFFTEGDRLCFIVKDPYGKKDKKYWVDMPPRMAKAVNKEVDDYLNHKEEESKMSPDELRERYKEYGSS